MLNTGRAGCGVEAVDSTKREPKEPIDGRFIGSTCFTDYSDAQGVRFSRSCRSFHPDGSPFNGLFHFRPSAWRDWRADVEPKGAAHQAGHNAGRWANSRAGWYSESCKSGNAMRRAGSESMAKAGLSF